MLIKQWDFFQLFPLSFHIKFIPIGFFFVGVNAIVIMFGVLLRTKQSFTSYSFRANKMVLILAAKPKELSLTSQGWREKLSRVSLRPPCAYLHIVHIYIYKMRNVMYFTLLFWGPLWHFLVSTKFYPWQCNLNKIILLFK